MVRIKAIGLATLVSACCWAQTNLPSPVQVLRVPAGPAPGELRLCDNSTSCTTFGDLGITGNNAFRIKGRASSNGVILLQPGNVAGLSEVHVLAPADGWPGLVIQDHSAAATNGLALWNNSNAPYFSLDGSNAGDATFRALNSNNFDFFGGSLLVSGSTPSLPLVSSSQSGAAYALFAENIGGTAISTARFQGSSTAPTLSVSNSGSHTAASFTGNPAISSDGALFPAADLTYNFGDSGLRWNNAWIDNIITGITGAAAQCVQATMTGQLVGTGALCGGSGSSPAGADTQIQINKAGVFGVATGFVFDYTNNLLGINTPTPADSISITSALNGTTQATITNTSSGNAAQINFRAVNDAGLATFTGIFGSGKTAYGAVNSSEAFDYTNSLGLTMMADNPSGVIKFAAGGNAELMRITAGGDFLTTSGTANFGKVSAFWNQSFIITNEMVNAFWYDTSLGSPAVSFKTAFNATSHCLVNATSPVVISINEICPGGGFDTFVDFLPHAANTLNVGTSGSPFLGVNAKTVTGSNSSGTAFTNASGTFLVDNTGAITGASYGSTGVILTSGFIDGGTIVGTASTTTVALKNLASSFTVDGNGDMVVHSCSGCTSGVTSIATTSPISGGTITTTGTISCATCLTTSGSQTISGPDTFQSVITSTISGSGDAFNAGSGATKLSGDGTGFFNKGISVNGASSAPAIQVNGTQILDGSRNLTNIQSATVLAWRFTCPVLG